MAMGLTPRFGWLSALVLLGGCVSPPPMDQALMASLMPKTPAEHSISGQPLRDCLTALGKDPTEVLDTEFARFSPDTTYKFVNLFRKGPADAPEYASRIRAYAARHTYDRKLLFVAPVKREDTFICFYDVGGGAPRYITRLYLDHDGKAEEGWVSDAAKNLYKGMSGKSLSWYDDFTLGTLSKDLNRI